MGVVATGGRNGGSTFWQFVPQLQHHPFRRLLADARDTRKSRDVVAPDRVAPSHRPAMPLRMVIASLGPIPLTVISFSNSSFSERRRKP